MLKNLLKSFVIFTCTPIALIFWILKLKFPYINISRIGHLMLECDCFIKEQLLYVGSKPRAIILAPKSKSANAAAVKAWSKYFFVIENKTLVLLMKPFQHHPWTKFDVSRYVSSNLTADTYRLYNEWGERSPLLKLNQSEIERGDEVLERLGVPKGTWYVCLHAREGGYSVSDEHFHKHRNIAISDFEKAIRYIVSQGGRCVRMGDSTMTPAPKMLGLIDYALSDYKEAWMDLYLSARCKFFLGSNSGAFSMATVYGVPCAQVGMTPLSVMGVGINDITIPMIHRSKALNQVLTFDEIFQSEVASYKLTEDYEKAGIVLEHNTPDDILDLTIEIHSRVLGSYEIKLDDELRQKKFKSLIKKGHYGYGAVSRIGNAFLKKYEYLLN